MSKKFLISEDDRQSILSLYKSKGIIFEEEVYDNKTIVSSEPINDWQVGENLKKDINDIMQSVQNKIFKKITLQCVSYPKPESIKDSFVFSIINDGKDTGQKIELKYDEVQRKDNFQVSKFYRNFFSFISCGSVPIVEYLDPIYKNKDYIILFEKYPQLEKTVNNLTVNLSIEPYKSDSIAIGGVIWAGKGQYNLTSLIPFGDKITTDGTGNTIFKLKLNKNTYYSLEVVDAKMQLANIEVPNPAVKPSTPTLTPPPPPPKFVPRSVGGNVGEPFIFNKTKLADDGEAQIKKFVDQFLILKRTDPDLYYAYIEELNQKYKDTGINVYAYSSIDDDPNQIINYVEGEGGNAVDGCGGKQLRSAYNLCLSRKRAEVIAARLNTDLSDFPDFKGVGMGESKSVNGVGWTKDDPTTDAETLPNRRFEVDLPEYSDVQRVGNN